MANYYKLIIILAILAFLLLVAGLATPLWIWMYEDDEYVGVGLFYRIGLDEDDINTATSVNNTMPKAFLDVKFADDDTVDTTHWSATIGLEVAATVLALILLPLIYLNHRRHLSSKDGCLAKIVLGVSIFSCVLNVAGLVIFIIYHGDALTEAPDITRQSFSWATVICFVGALLHFIISLIVFVQYNMKSFTAIPTAADSKMELYPMSKQGLMSRYYQSTPYPADKPIEGDHRPSIMPTQEFHQDNQRPAILSRQDTQALVPVGNQRRSNVSKQDVQTFVPRTDQRPSFMSIEDPLVMRPTDTSFGQLHGLVSRNDQHSHYQNDKNELRRTSTLSPYDVISKRDVINVPVETQTQRVVVRNIFHNEQRSTPVIRELVDDNTQEKELMYTGNGFIQNVQTYQNMNGQVGHGVQRVGKTIFLARRGMNDDVEEEEVVFNRLNQDALVPNVKKESKDFFVTAKHGMDRDAHRDERYLRHTHKPSEVEIKGQRLVLDPTNFSGVNVKYNPSYVYRPYAEQIY